MSDVADRVKKIVLEHLGVEESKVVESASFIDDLGADSLRYLPIDSVAYAIGISEESLCRACLTGQYPTETGTQLYQIAMKHEHHSTGRTYESQTTENLVR